MSSKKSGKERKANRNARKMVEGKHPHPKPVSEMLQEQLTGVVDGVVKGGPAVLRNKAPRSTKELKEQRQDIALLETGVKQRWPIAPEKKPRLVDRLITLAHKKTTVVNSKIGPIEVDNDSNCIAAIRTLVAMESDNQSDEHHADKQSKPGTPSTAVQVNVVNGQSEITGNPNDPTIDAELEAVKAAVNDPTFIEFRRRRALGCDTQPGAIRPLGIAGAMESSPPLNGNGQSRNGSSHV